MRRLVIDASVAASAGTSDHPESAHCRSFLEVMQQANHAMVMTSAIVAEWELFQGRFAAAWFAAMVSRGRVQWVKSRQGLALRGRIGKCSGDSALVRIMLDDLHLVEAALASDSLIASKDDEALTAFCAASATIPEL